jgi:putative MATE family efflux protein
MQQNGDLTTRPIPELVRSLGIPAAIGYLFHTLYNVVDTFYAGLISTEALAALSLAFPVFFIIIALGSGVSTGVTALIGHALGAGKREEAQQLAMQALVFGLFLSILVTVGGILASPWLFGVLGASGEYLGYCLAYMNIVFIGAVFFIISFICNGILNSVGDTKSFRNVLTLGFVLNVGLDPLFIYGIGGIPGMGFKGVAVATILIQGIACVYMGYKVRKAGLMDMCSGRCLIPRAGPFADIARQGFPASMNMLTVGLGIFIITYFLSWFGKEAVAAYGIATRIEQLVLLPSIGLNVAVLALSAQNGGAGLYDRVFEVVRTALKYGAVCMGIGLVVVFFLAEPMMRLFTQDAAVVEIGVSYLRIAAFALYAYVVLFAYVAVLQGLKRPMFAVWIGIVRQLVAPVIVFYVLIKGFGLGVYGIWWGVFVVVWCSALFSWWYASRRMRHIAAVAEREAAAPQAAEAVKTE